MCDKKTIGNGSVELVREKESYCKGGERTNNVTENRKARFVDMMVVRWESEPITFPNRTVNRHYLALGQ